MSLTVGFEYGSLAERRHCANCKETIGFVSDERLRETKFICACGSWIVRGLDGKIVSDTRKKPEAVSESLHPEALALSELVHGMIADVHLLRDVDQAKVKEFRKFVEQYSELANLSTKILADLKALKDKFA